MDTTYIEYELRKLKELVAELVADKAKPDIDPDYVVDLPRKPSIGSAKVKLNTPPAPKFWVKYKQKHPCNVDPSRLDTSDVSWSTYNDPVYCFAREMWANMLREYSRCSHTVSPLSFINSYLESNGGV